MSDVSIEMKVPHGNIVQVDSRISGLPEPNLLSEIDDIVRVDFPCHPEEPLKIDEIWEQDVACFVCCMD